MPSGRRARLKSANCEPYAAEPRAAALAVPLAPTLPQALTPALTPAPAPATGAASAVSSVMVWKPDVTVAAVIERGDRFLLVEERIRGQLVLNQPAGHLEDGEALVDAVVRETLEETAWQFTADAVLGFYQWRSPRGQTTLRIAFTGSVHDYDPARPLDAPIVNTHWLARDEIAQRSARLRTPLVLRCIEDYLTGRRLPLDALSAEVSAPKVALKDPSVKVPTLKVPRAT